MPSSWTSRPSGWRAAGPAGRSDDRRPDPRGGSHRLVECARAFDIDLLVNNAGASRFGRFIDSPGEVEQQTVLLNVVAVVDLTRRLLPDMLAQARARRHRAGLIIVASAAAFAPVPMFATYAASKAFDLRFTEALAEGCMTSRSTSWRSAPVTRTGFGPAPAGAAPSMPGAADADGVAAAGLAALGHRTLCVGGRLNGAVLAPVVAPRRLVAGALGVALRFVAGRH
ncbi:MAG: SDR family NAD(P)-dependent oxidoreductase [Rhodospirillales bacterium]|nr:SDR family NAD(P)-dependent oxidoreductase [Rhodospirillales bacterium]